jgi:hypothetical protein
VGWGGNTEKWRYFGNFGRREYLTWGGSFVNSDTLITSGVGIPHVGSGGDIVNSDTLVTSGREVMPRVGRGGIL